MRTPLLLLLAGLVAAAACSSDGSTAPTSTTADSASSNGYTIAIDSATNGDTVTVATVLAVHVHVTQHGVAAPNMPVGWTVESGHGSVASASTVTDSTGTATVNWTMGDTAGVNSVTAAITGASVTIVATAVGGVVSALVKVGPDSQSVVAGGTVPLTAEVVDRFGNAVSNAAVTWSTSGGALSAAASTTGSTGDAVTNLTTDAVPATYLVTASIPGLASVTFRIVGS